MRNLAGDWTPRQWAITVAVTVTAVVIAMGIHAEQRTTNGVFGDAAAGALAALGNLQTTDGRSEISGYSRDAFGASWTDAVAVAGGGNGCDTRNDVLSRDLRDIRVGVTRACPHAVLSGEFVSPYSGDFIVFDRDRGPADVQVDHVIPLAYAWDMGAAAWSMSLRMNFANDPANLVAVDGPSNQAKSDAEPARWMPPERGFWCQYAIQFTVVAAAYGLKVDTASRDVIAEALADC